MTIVLWNIRSAWNVGSIIRSCDAVGADIILVGYTPRPEGLTLKAIIKTSIGAEKNVKWQAFDHFQEVLNNFPNHHHWGIEINSESQDIFKFLDEQGTKSNSKKIDSEININKGSEKLPSQSTIRPDVNSTISWENTCLWFGNEITGLTEEVGKMLDGQLHLPMVGKKESLNVANTVTATAYLWWSGTRK